VLATATNQEYASEVAQHLEIFDEVVASDERNNLLGASKRDRLVERFGLSRFDYAGDAWKSLESQPYCRGAILVNASDKLRKRAELGANVIKIV